MVQVEMNGFKINNLSILNDIKEEGEKKLKNTFDFNVEYDRESELAFAFLTEKIEMVGDPKEFYIDLVLEGVFHVTGIKNKNDRKNVHLKLYDALFPYASHVLSHITLDCGLPGLMIQKHPLELGEVHLGETPQNKNGKIIDMK